MASITTIVTISAAVQLKTTMHTMAGGTVSDEPMPGTRSEHFQYHVECRMEMRSDGRVGVWHNKFVCGHWVRWHLAGRSGYGHVLPHFPDRFLIKLLRLNHFPNRMLEGSLGFASSTCTRA